MLSKMVIAKNSQG